MDTQTTELMTFDIQLLLKITEMDIRNTSADYQMLKVGQYFELLSKFVNLKPAAADHLAEIDEKVADLRDSGVFDSESLRKKLLATASAHTLSDEVLGQTLAEYITQADEDENRKLRILCVDDAAFMLHTISAVLREEYEVFSLTKGKLVAGFLRNTTPDLILLDYNMPEIDGFELVPVIRSFPEHKDTPIIFLTAAGSSYHVAAAVSLGACDYIVKPLKADVLRTKIAQHIVRKKFY